MTNEATPVTSRCRRIEIESTSLIEKRRRTRFSWPLMTMSIMHSVRVMVAILMVAVVARATHSCV